jgi:hypothetical protein
MTFFCCVIDQKKRVTTALRCGDHDLLVQKAGLQDNTLDRNLIQFARIIIDPENYSILNPSAWHLSIHLDGKPPAWWTLDHQQACHRAHDEWLEEVYKYIVKKAVINPFAITPPEITEDHIRLLHEWANLFPTPGYSVETEIPRPWALSYRCHYSIL